MKTRSAISTGRSVIYREKAVFSSRVQSDSPSTFKNYVSVAPDIDRYPDLEFFKMLLNWKLSENIVNFMQKPLFLRLIVQANTEEKANPSFFWDPKIRFSPQKQTILLKREYHQGKKGLHCVDIYLFFIVCRESSRLNYVFLFSFPSIGCFLYNPT